MLKLHFQPVWLVPFGQTVIERNIITQYKKLKRVLQAFSSLIVLSSGSIAKEELKSCLNYTQNKPQTILLLSVSFFKEHFF